MPENNPTPTPAPAPFDSTEFFRKYSKAASSEERAKLLAADRPAVTAGVMNARHLEQAVMPLYKATTERLSENAWWDKAVLLKDLAVGAAGVAITYKGGKLLYTWLKGPV